MPLKVEMLILSTEQGYVMCVHGSFYVWTLCTISMILSSRWMKGWSDQEGSTLFGVGYDFQESNRCAVLPLWEELQILLVICVENYSWFLWYRFLEHMEGLRKKLETIFEASGGKKVGILSHCTGGLLVKSFVALHHEVKISFTLKSRR